MSDPVLNQWVVSGNKAEYHEVGRHYGRKYTVDLEVSFDPTDGLCFEVGDSESKPGGSYLSFSVPLDVILQISNSGN